MEMMQKDDKGHIALFEDVGELYEEVKEYQFHDYFNGRYALPKMKLAKKLTEIKQNVLDGKYDNDMKT